MIQFQQVSKTYQLGAKSIQALHPTSLHIEAGQIYGLIGHSGAGKSTLMRLINRLEEPSTGEILIQGQNITQLAGKNLRSLRQQVGMIFQHFNLLSSRTVAANVALPLELAGKLNKQQIQAKVQQLLERVGLSHRAGNYPAQLSGGEKQRVGIARALTTDPSILLCDEATSALDPQTTNQVLQLLAEINQELGITLVVITHEMDVVRKICHQVAVMEAGQIVEQGKVLDVFLHPQHPTTQKFVQEANPDNTSVAAANLNHIQGTLVQLTFQGEATYQPLLAKVVQQTGIEFSILSGRIDRIGNEPYGQLTLALSGANLEQAMQLLTTAQVDLQVLRHG